MAQIVVSLTFVSPWWLKAAVFLARQWFGWRAVITGREPSDAELERFADWWGRHVKVIAS